MNAKDAYIKLCEMEKSIPLFSSPWWLDATAGEKNWDVVVVKNNEKIIAALPFVKKKKYSFKFLSQPPLTQTLGPWLRPSEAKYSKALGQQKDLMEELIAKLPKFDHYSQNWHYKQTNWLPFFWAGFEQTTRYTYILDDISNEGKLWDNLQENVRREIRKASDKYKLVIREDLDFEKFITLNNLVFKRQGMKTPYSETLIKNIDSVCAKRNSRKFFIAEDHEGKYHAGVYIVWDENSAYYLMGGGDPDLRNSGATSLCMWEAIKFASTVTKQFDFEGSMIEPIERFFRSFGAKQVAYFSIRKTNSKILKIRNLMSLFRK